MTVPDWSAIHAVADRLTPEMRQRFLAAVQALADSVDVEAVIRAIAAGQVARAQRLLAFTDLPAYLQPAALIVRHAILEAATVAAAQLVRQVGISAAQFSMTNPYAVAAADRMAADFVTNVTAETRLAIRGFIRRAIADGVTSAQTARLLRPVVGLTRRDTQAVMNYRAELAKSGMSGDRAAALTARYAERKVRERAETISRTELIDASSAGQQAIWQEMVARGVLPETFEQEWVITPDDRLCPICAALKGQRRKLGEPFVSPYNGMTAMRPPLHPRCRCALRMARQTAAKQEAA
jgi:hypothetical protein